MNPKTLGELKAMGVDLRFAQYVVDFQKENELSKMEMILLLQRVQCFVLDNLILDMREDNE